MIESLRTATIVAFLALGLGFSIVSAIGVLRLPDIYSRAHAASEVDALGAGLALGGVAVAAGPGSTALKAVLLLVFIFITNPTAAHAIARAASEEGIEVWTRDDRSGNDSASDGDGESPPEAATDGGATETPQSRRDVDRSPAGTNPDEPGSRSESAELATDATDTEPTGGEHE